MAVYSPKLNYIFFANPNTASKAIAKTLKAKLEGQRIPDGEVRDPKTNKVLVRAHHCTHQQLVSAGLLTEEQLQGLFKFTGVRNPFDQMVSKYVKHCSRLNNDPAAYPWRQADRVAAAMAEDDEDDGESESDSKPKGKGKGKVKKAQAALASAEVPANLAVANEHMNEAQADFLNWLRLMDVKYAKVGKLENGPLDFLDRADYVIRFEALQEGFLEVQKRLGVTEPVEIMEFNVTAAREEAPKKKKRYQDFYVAESQAIVARMFAPVIERFGYQFES